MKIVDGGLNVTSGKHYQMVCEEEKKYCAVTFINQSVQYNITIRVGGIVLTLVPGDSVEFTAQPNSILTSVYDCNFKAFAGPAAAKPFLVVATQKYVD